MSSSTTLPPPYYNSDKSSFAYVSARERWPIILTQAIDDVSRAVGNVSSENTGKIAEGKEIIKEISALLYDLDHDKLITPFSGETVKGLASIDSWEKNPLFVDLKGYNKDLDKLDSKFKTWLKAPWLFSECFLYRKLGLFFQVSKYWKNYDFFEASKTNAFKSSKEGVIELALRYKKLSEQLTNLEKQDNKISEEDKKTFLEELFKEFVDISLWGNATDLSLLTNMSLADIKKLQGAEVRRKNEANILVNDVDFAWRSVFHDSKYNTRQQKSSAGGSVSSVDIVLDNAGFELFTDLVFALFLLDSKLTSRVVLHPKSIPWFVSDVLPHDFVNLIHQLKDPKFFVIEGKNAEHREALDFISDKLNIYYDGNNREVSVGKIEIRTSPFWTTQYGFNDELRENGAGGGDEVWKLLKQTSSLVVFKGDLNHRKLLGDLEWERTTPFEKAVGSSLNKGGLRLVTFRTIKADVVVGLPTGKEKELNEEWKKKKKSESNGKTKDDEYLERGWAYSGKWAVIEYSGTKY